MGMVDITHISKPFFVSAVLFLIVILSCLSIGIVQLFSKKTKRGIFFFGMAVLSSILYALLVHYWLADTMPKTP